MRIKAFAISAIIFWAFSGPASAAENALRCNLKDGDKTDFVGTIQQRGADASIIADVRPTLCAGSQFVIQAKSIPATCTDGKSIKGNGLVTASDKPGAAKNWLSDHNKNIFGSDYYAVTAKTVQCE